MIINKQLLKAIFKVIRVCKKRYVVLFKEKKIKN